MRKDAAWLMCAAREGMFGAQGLAPPAACKPA